MTLNELQETAYFHAVTKGFWDADASGHAPSVAEKLCLIHSEVSEVLEEVRNAPLTGRNDFKKIYVVDGKLEGVAIELADVIIRVADLAEKLGVNLTEAVEVKMEYNRTRPHRHGGKAL